MNYSLNTMNIKAEAVNIQNLPWLIIQYVSCKNGICYQYIYFRRQRDYLHILSGFKVNSYYLKKAKVQLLSLFGETTDV